MAQKLDVHGYVMVPRNVVGRLIGKGGTNVKMLQRSSGASRIGFDKEAGGRAATQACTLQASDIEAAIGAAKVILEAVPDPGAPLEHKQELQRRREDWGGMVGELRGAERGAEPVADATREMAVEAHRAKFGSVCLNSDQQTKERPSELAAVDFEVWMLQRAVCTPFSRGENETANARR
uniref:K Homology domain-containing protein n=1 Tax=Emiliania huxleyi TaxID=2903 RepID=A0A7S3RCZ5_EMIHU